MLITLFVNVTFELFLNLGSRGRPVQTVAPSLKYLYIEILGIYQGMLKIEHLRNPILLSMSRDVVAQTRFLAIDIWLEAKVLKIHPKTWLELCNLPAMLPADRQI